MSMINAQELSLGLSLLEAGVQAEQMIRREASTCSIDSSPHEALKKILSMQMTSCIRQITDLFIAFKLFMSVACMLHVWQ